MSSTAIALDQTASEQDSLKKRGYTLIKKLGEGSFAKVYLTEYRPRESSVVQKMACKIINIENAPEQLVMKFLPRELNILVKLNHPHCIFIHGIFQRRQKCFIFMRYAEGGDILEHLITGGSIREGQARIWTQQITLAVQYLHAMEIAHRDIKCENILVTENNNVKLADFGFARRMLDSKYRQVLSSTYCGSLSYAAPEILLGNPYNPKISDIWALGVALFMMLNKAMPFDDRHMKILYENQIKKHWKFRAKVAQRLSPEVKEFMKHMLEPELTKRYNVDDILKSDWIEMDERLMSLTTLEAKALETAREEGAKFEKLRIEQAKIDLEKPAVDEPDGLLPIQHSRTSAHSRSGLQRDGNHSIVLTDLPALSREHVL